jgi:hypothetical protein
MYLRYIGNKRTIVEEQDNGDILARSRLDDTFFDIEVELLVRPPELEILSARGELRRAFNEKCKGTPSLLQKVIGNRISSGLNKRVKDAISGPEGCPRMANLVLECCNEIISAFTTDQLITPLLGSDVIPDEESRKFLENPRLVNNCITFALDSPLRKRLGLPE